MSRPTSERMLEKLRGSSPPESLYLHVPFCVHRCHYCDFSVRRTSDPPIDDWLSCIAAELDAWVNLVGWSQPWKLRTIYVGGGTPSLLGASGMARLRGILEERCVLGGSLEWTAEANPHSFDAALASAWRSIGVNRVSIGVQSFDEPTLAWLGRMHDVHGAVRAVDAALGAGFVHVNIDLIFGLPDDVRRRWDEEVRTVKRLGVPHVSTYGLTADRGTPLGRQVELGRVHMPGQSRYGDEYLESVRRLAGAGFGHYEVSNFALPGQECLHNWQYWNGAAYLGVGPSAHSYLPPFRAWNVFRWDAYRMAIRDQSGPLEGLELIDGEKHDLERLWLGLRTREGIALRDPSLSGTATWLDRWSEAGWVVLDGERLTVTAEGWLRLDEMTSELAAHRAGASLPETRRRATVAARQGV